MPRGRSGPLRVPSPFSDPVLLFTTIFGRIVQARRDKDRRSGGGGGTSGGGGGGSSGGGGGGGLVEDEGEAGGDGAAAAAAARLLRVREGGAAVLELVNDSAAAHAEALGASRSSSSEGHQGSSEDALMQIDALAASVTHWLRLLNDGAADA